LISGGTNTTLQANKNIQALRKRIEDAFIRMYTLFPSPNAYTIDSPEVTDHMNGLFWLDTNIDRKHMLQQRKIIDAWCELERACEERDYIHQDAVRIQRHCTSDLLILKLELSYAHHIEEDMIMLYGYLIKKEEIRLEEQLSFVNSFLLSIE